MTSSIGARAPYPGTQEEMGVSSFGTSQGRTFRKRYSGPSALTLQVQTKNLQLEREVSALESRLSKAQVKIITDGAKNIILQLDNTKLETQVKQLQEEVSARDRTIDGLETTLQDAHKRIHELAGQLEDARKKLPPA